MTAPTVYRRDPEPTPQHFTYLSPWCSCPQGQTREKKLKKHTFFFQVTTILVLGDSFLQCFGQPDKLWKNKCELFCCFWIKQHKVRWGGNSHWRLNVTMALNDLCRLAKDMLLKPTSHRVHYSHDSVRQRKHVSAKEKRLYLKIITHLLSICSQPPFPYFNYQNSTPICFLLLSAGIFEIKISLGRNFRIRWIEEQKRRLSPWRCFSPTERDK